MPIKIKERFLYYPLAFMVIFLILFTKYGESGVATFLYNFIGVFQESVDEMNVPISETTFIAIYGYLVGYVYGTFSLLIKVRKIKGFIQLVLGFFKLLASMFFVVYGVFTIIIELLLMPLGLYFMKKYKKKKEVKKNDELMDMMKRAIREENEDKKPMNVSQTEQ